MENERKDHKDAVETVLKALGSVEAPEGLEARVAARLAQGASVRGTEFRWRDVVAGSAVGGVWWRGAVCGVAASMLAVGVVILAGHFMGQPGVHSVREVGPPVAPARAEVVAVREDRRKDCAAPELLRAVEGGSAQRHDGVRIEIAERPRLMTGSPLTAEERGLVRLAKHGDLKELASLNPEVRERLEAEEAAQFRSFFAEPVKPVVAEAAMAPVAVEQAPVAAEQVPAAVEQSPVEVKPSAERPTVGPATEPVTGTISGENE